MHLFVHKTHGVSAICVSRQDDYFVNSEVKACAKKDLPKLPDCHEWTTKKRKQQHQHPHPHPQQQQPQHMHPHGASHMPGPYGHQHPGRYKLGSRLWK